MSAPSKVPLEPTGGLGQTAGLLIFERVVALASTTTFGNLPDHVLAHVARVAEEATFHQGEVLMAEGDEEPWMFVLLSGTARATTGDRALSDLKAGAVIGELAVLDPAPRSATVTATSRCHLLRIDRHLLREVMAEHPALSEGLIVGLARQLRQANTRPGESAPDTATQG